MTAGPPALEALEVSVRAGHHVILQEINVALLPGEAVALVGPNGSGKTTLLRTLAGLTSPLTGEVRLGGRPMASWTRRSLAQEMAFLPQHSEVPFPTTVVDHVLLGRAPHQHGLGLASANDLARTAEALRRLEVSDLADRAVTTMSGGELQRVGLARVLLQDARVWLLDEPTSAQDPRGVLLVSQLLKEETQNGRVLLAAVHDLSLAFCAFDRVIVLREGRVLSHFRSDQPNLEALERAFRVSFRVESDQNGAARLAARALC